MKKLTILLILSLCNPVFGQMKPMLGRQINWADPITRGLAAYWPMNETSGNRIFDLSGNGKTGLAGGATSEISWQSGPQGKVVDFVGNNEAGFQFSSLTFAATDAWTIVVKLKADGEANEGVLLGSYADSNDYIWFREGLRVMFENSVGGSTLFTSVTSFTLWSTYAFVAKGDGNLHFYLNGALKETDAVVTSFIIDNIGSAFGSGIYAFDGKVSYVSLYNRALTSSEIALLYREPFCMFKADRTSFWQSLQGNGASIPVIFHSYKMRRAG